MIAQKFYYHLTDQEFASIRLAAASNTHILAELEKADSILRPIGLKTYAKRSKLHLLSLPLERKLEALAKLMDYASFVTNITEKEIDLSNDKSCLNYLIQKYGFKISTEFINKLEVGDAVEIIDTTGVQIYRNYSLLMLTNYDILSLCLHEWPDLYARDSQITRVLLESCGVLFNQNTALYEYKTGGHLMVEKMSDKNYQFFQTHKYGASVLNKDNSIIGLILSIRAKKIGSHTDSNLLMLHPH